MKITEDSCFYPDSIIYFDPVHIGLQREDIWVEERLHCWFIQPRKETFKSVTIINLHGNAENMTSHIMGALFFLEMGHRLVTFDYSGYGQSKGRPTLSGIQDDARAVFRFVFDLPVRFGETIFGFGQSMGGFTLARILPDFPELTGTILDSALYSFYDLFREAYPFAECNVPQVSALDTLPLSAVPKLFILGTADEVVPYTHSLKMFASAHEPKDILILEGVGHISALTSPFADQYVARVKTFLADLS